MEEYRETGLGQSSATSKMETDDYTMDLSPAPSLDLNSLLNDDDDVSRSIRGEEEIRVDVPREEDTGTQTKLGHSEIQKDTKHVNKGQNTLHYQEPVAKLPQVYHQDPRVERNQLQGLETQQPIWQSHCTGLKQKAPLSEQEVDCIKATQEFKDLVKKNVGKRMYGFTEDVEAVIIEFLLEKNGTLPTSNEFHSTWATMRVQLKKEKEAEKRKRVRLEKEKEVEKRKRVRLEEEKEEEKRERMRLEKEKEVEKRKRVRLEEEKEAEKWKRVRLESDIEAKKTRINFLEGKLQIMEESKLRSS